MALTIREEWQSGSGSFGRDANDLYSAIIVGLPSDNADDYYTIKQYANGHFASVAPGGNVLVSVNVHRISSGTWIATADYRSPTESRPTNTASFAFTTGGGQTKITHSRKTIAKYPADPAEGAPEDSTPGAPDMHGAINVTGPNQIEGVEIHTRAFDFRITFYAPSRALSSTYVANVYKWTSVVNTDLVIVDVDGINLTFDPGSLLFLNGEGGKRKGYGDWEFTLNFSGVPGVSDLTIGDITGIEKRGHDYLWVYCRPSVDDASKTMTPKPQGVYIEQVYDYQPLAPLLAPSGFAG